MAEVLDSSIMADNGPDAEVTGSTESPPTKTWSLSSDDDDEDPAGYYGVMTTTWFISLYLFVYSVIFLLGFVGNVLVVVAVVKKKAMQTVTNIFITNLAVADLCLCFSVIIILINVFIDWVFGKTLCRLMGLAKYAVVYISTMTSSVIAIDRYLLIVYPFKPRMKVSLCVLIIVAIWVISVCNSLPMAFNSKLLHFRNSTTAKCFHVWSNFQDRQFFHVTTLVLQYVVPCIIIIFCYSKIGHTLQQRSKMKTGRGWQSQEREERDIARMRRTNKMLILMVVIFISCWMPNNAVQMLADFNEEAVSWHYFALARYIAYLIAVSSTIYNPFLYTWNSENFRNEFQTILPCLFAGCRRGRGSSRHTGVVEVPSPPPRPPLSPSPLPSCSTARP